MNGSQSLFGAKADLQFGKLKITGLVSEQKGESSTIQIQGGARSNTFSISADQYDANRHFFLSLFHAGRYEKALSSLPLIQSGFNITRIEVWVTNKNSSFNDARNIIALSDTKQSNSAPNNSVDVTYQSLLARPSVRQFEETNSVMTQLGLVSGRDYEKIESARKLTSSEYTLNAQLGYLSLKTALNADEVLAVAYEYTYGGKIYKVGEFSDDGFAAPKALIVRMIKNTNLSPKSPCWELMMKNIYAIGNAQLSGDNFELDIQYKDETTGTKTPYIGEGKIKNIPLIRVLGLDQLSGSEAQFPDGQFDYLKGVTVMETDGKNFKSTSELDGKKMYSVMKDEVSYTWGEGVPMAGKLALNCIKDLPQGKGNEAKSQVQDSEESFEKATNVVCKPVSTVDISIPSNIQLNRLRIWN
jgi:cell surface protein SprA